MQKRMSLYRDIHKGLRGLLLDLNHKAGRLDFSDGHSANQFRADARAAFRLLEGHAENETTFVAPLIEKHAPHLARRIEQTHDHHELAMHELTRDLDSLDHDWVVRLSQFTGEAFLHMAEEEQEIMPALWERMTDEELIDVEQRLVASIPPDKLGAYLSWMLPAMSAPERVSMLAGARGSAPPEVFAFVRNLARGVLTAADDAALERGLAATAAGVEV